MSRINLSQIEANVVFVAVNKAAGTVHISPFWECDAPAADLPEMAARFGLWANEQDGSGYTRVEIHDFRTEV